MCLQLMLRQLKYEYHNKLSKEINICHVRACYEIPGTNILQSITTLLMVR
jgi:hypothetical protein